MTEFISGADGRSELSFSMDEAPEFDIVLANTNSDELRVGFSELTTDSKADGLGFGFHRLT